PSGHPDVGLPARGLLQPVLGQDGRAFGTRALQDELAEARIVARGGLDAAAADLLPGLAQQPRALLLHAGRAPDLLLQVLRQGLARGLADQDADQVGFARAVVPALARGRGAWQPAQVA